MPQRDAAMTTRALSVRADSVNDEARSFEAVLSTERQVSVLDREAWRTIDEVLRADGATYPEQVPLLDSHARESTDNVLGSIRNMRVENGQLVGTVFMDTDDPSAVRAFGKVKRGHITDVSIGYRADEFVDIAPGQTKTVAGKSYTADRRTLRITTKYSLREGSLVPIGADEGAKIREEITTGQTPHEQEKPDMAEKETNIEGVDAPVERQDEATQPKKVPVETVREEVTPAGADDHIIAEKQAERIRSEERQRLADINERADLAKVDTELRQRAINEGWSPEKASDEFLRAMRAERSEPVGGGAPAAHTRNHEFNERALAAGMLIRGGMDPTQVERPKGVSEQDWERAANQGDRFRDMSLVDTCRAIAQMTGARDPETGSVPYGRNENIRAAVSTPALTNVFTTSVNARLLAGYNEVPDTTAPWVREADVADFKTNDRISLGKTGALEKLPRGDTAKHATISDGIESYKVIRYAKQFVIDEQDIIDDNLGVFSDMPMEMGAAARRLRPDLVYSILLANATLNDTGALFNSTAQTTAGGHANLGSTALGVAGLQSAITAMKKFTQDGVRLDVRPQFLIVPADLEWTARELLTSGQLIATDHAASASTVGGNRNVLSDLNMTLIVEGRIDATGVTDPASGTAYTGSATNYFLAASPRTARTIEVGYIAGSGRRPMLRSFRLDRGQWGIGWDIKHDIGAKALDYRGLYQGNS